jgi:peptide/nickel transport system substrate-binding protein
MKKVLTRVVCLTLGALTAFSVVGCKKNKNKDQEYNPEERPVVFSISALDGNFNPFFATSATDVTIAAQTQISMLTTDAKGQPVAGKDYPTVAQAFTQRMMDGSAETKDGSKADTTEYEFLIKNGIKFSDGTPLTIKDVLFNLYVYLDPMYMGSATIYSTKIIGLNDYRLQELNASDADTNFETSAEARFNNILDYLESNSNEPSATVAVDIETMKELYKEELTSDWNTYSTALESYKETHRFTKAWELYYLMENVISEQKYQDASGNEVYYKDDQGRYYTDLDPDHLGNPSDFDASEENAATDETIKNIAIERAYTTNTSTKEGLIRILYESNTANTLMNQFVQDALSEWAEGKKNDDGSLIVPKIEGITTYKTKNFNGEALEEEHDVLKIVIEKVDPKAIWNFAFSVAPMHYYSNETQVQLANDGKGFGVDFANKEFFDKVLQDPHKNALPMGAGVYMASDSNGSDDPQGKDFFNNNWVYYKRNPYFETVGSGLSNAKIKYMRYKVVGSDQIFNSLINKEIDVGEPNATQTNINRLAEHAHLGYSNYLTNGYGYVGINPKFVPDIEVRQAIMKALNTNSIITDYYSEALASPIYRSMSTTSWAYPVMVKSRPDSLQFTRVKSDIEKLVSSARWTKGNDGIYRKDGKPLELTFTIAGETKDHPAYKMFQSAATFLNDCGFKITVVTDVSALKKLATGNLAVWAAAWSSAIDPDLYQVYHKNSKATSVKNWGYDVIIGGDSEQFGYEQLIIDELSGVIDEARATINQDRRKELYKDALDYIMDLAVELPTYQRNDLVVYNQVVLNKSTLNSNPSATSGVFDRLWELNYN